DSARQWFRQIAQQSTPELFRQRRPDSGERRRQTRGLRRFFLEEVERLFRLREPENGPRARRRNYPLPIPADQENSRRSGLDVRPLHEDPHLEPNSSHPPWIDFPWCNSIRKNADKADTHS